VEYERELEWNEPPTRAELRYARWTVVRAAGPPAAAWWPLARIGAVDLYLAPPGRERDAPARSITPLVAAKRGRRGSGAYAGVDGHVQLDAFEDGGAEVGADAVAPPTPYAPPLFAIDSPAIRVAVIDVSFDDVAALPLPAEGPFRVGLPDDDPSVEPPSVAGLGHGTAMAGVVQAVCPVARVGLFEIPGVAGAARPYLASADLAAAVATAVGAWQADVVLVAMSEGAWGTPRYLRDVLREAARCGRQGRGTPIVCSVGDPSRNHARQDDTAALGADDLASQPWVLAIAACDARGGWYRVYPGYHCAGGPPANGNGGPGATYNRLGPAVAMAAPGEPTRWSEHIAADDSSQASALAAAALARVLAENRALTGAELRALLALTADVPAVVDGGAGLAAGAFDARDRLGHNFKTGHGPVNVPAACLAAADPVCLALLATRPMPDPAGESTAHTLARAWLQEVRAAANRGVPPAREYLEIAGRLSRLFLTSLPVQEALCWLARHVRALAEAARPALWTGQDHGALVERIRHAIDTAWDAVDVSGADATRLQALDGLFAGAEAGIAVSTALARIFGPAVMASDGGQGRARSIALAGDAVGDPGGRRGPRRAGGGDVRERGPFAGADLSRAVR
jgi:hypothetical protein